MREQQLIAAGHRPNENQPSGHELAEVARVLKGFGGKAPLPHNHGIPAAREEEAPAVERGARPNPQAA